MKFFKMPIEVIFIIILLSLSSANNVALGKENTTKPIVIASSSDVISFDQHLFSNHFVHTLSADIDSGYFTYFPHLKKYFSPHKTAERNVQWLLFSVYNKDSKVLPLKLSVAFSDYCELYTTGNLNQITNIKSGDRVRLSDREIKTGQVAFLPLKILPSDTLYCLLKITNGSQISKQFASLSLQSVKLYSPTSFTATFEQPRAYQSFFYGAIAIMILFNFFIFITTRSSSYLFYVCFLFSLAVFLASNNGYLLEQVFPNHPTTDLYLRFFSAPILIISYLIFSQHYLQSKLHAPRLNPIITALAIGFALLIVTMLLGFWQVSRLAVIALAVASFFVIFWVAIQAIRKGYSPAKFFLAGNALLLLGGMAFSFQRIYAVVQNPATQYSIQLAALLEIVLFSMGLADRINVTERELNTSKILKERTEKEAEMERKKIIEEKNIALLKSNQELDAFIYKTAHDIRGPLARLMGLCNIAQLDVKDEVALDYFDKLNSNANNLNFILARLTKVYEISSLQVQPQPIELHRIIKDTIDSLSFYEGFGNTQFDINIPENLPFINDERLMRFIAINLIENAIKFQVSNNAKLHRVTIEIKPSKQSIIMTVTDNGVGIEPEDRDTIFDIFSKAADQYQTPGLGLYMTKIGLEKIGGSISLSNLKSPTQFLMHIPMV